MRILKLVGFIRPSAVKSLGSRKRQFASETFANGQNYSYIQSMYEAYLKDPKSVHISWQSYFKNIDLNLENPYQPPPTLTGASTTSLLPQLGMVDVPSPGRGTEILDTMKVQLMVRAYQIRGHHNADLDPLKIRVKSDAPELEPEFYGFGKDDLQRKFYLGAGILPGFGMFLECLP